MILTALILALIGAVLNIIPFFGGLAALVVNFLLMFTFWFVIDKHLAAGGRAQGQLRAGHRGTCRRRSCSTC